MSLQIASPFQQFFDRDGSPLDNGFVYVGTVNLNPETNPITVYFDDALTIPAAQPLRTSNGYIVRNGSPARIYTSQEDFSLTVRDKRNVLVFTETDATSLSNLQAQLANGTSFLVDSGIVGYNQGGTGAVNRTVEGRLRDFVTVKDFGAIGDGVTDDTTAIQNALNTGKSVYVPSGTYNISALIYTTANGQVVHGDGITQTIIQNNTNNEPMFCFGNPTNPNGSTEFCCVESITFHGNTTGQTLWGVFVPCAGTLPQGVTEGISPAPSNYYAGKTSFVMATWSSSSRGCSLRDVRIRYIYGEYCLHVSAWAFVVDRVDLWSSERGLRNCGAANSNNFSDLYISSCSNEGIVHPDTASSIPTACFYNNAVVQQCGLDATGRGSIALLKGQATHFQTLYLERNNENGGDTDIFVGVSEIGCTFENVRHREEAGGVDPLQTIIETQGQGTKIGTIVFASDINEVVRVSGSDARTETFIYGPFEPVGTLSVTNGLIVDASTGLRTRGFMPTIETFGLSFDGVNRVYKGANKFGLRINTGSTQRMVLESSGTMAFCTDINNVTSGGNYTWGHNGGSGSETNLLTLQASNGNLYPGADNTQALGNASFRWSTIFAGTGTINTSDAREKQQVRNLSDAERAVAVRIKSLMRAFKFNDAVKIKGDGARIHFGVLAQDVKQAFKAEGLDPMTYGMICYDEWPEQEEERDEGGNIVQIYRPAGNLYGIRYDELLTFMIEVM